MINSIASYSQINQLSAAPPTGISSVGQEDSDLKNSLNKPVEQSAASSALGLRGRDANSQAQAEEDPVADESESQARPGEKTEAQIAQDQELIQELSARDREVRAHEQAHAAVGGQYAGAPSYQFQRGPDGVNYAVGGEVPIDVGKEATPQETIQKMDIVRRAALAPAEPSAQDRRVAAEATRKQGEAQSELQVERRQQAAESEEARESPQTDEQSATTTEIDSVAIDSASETSSQSTSEPSIQARDFFRALSNRSLLEASILATRDESRSGVLLSQYA